MKARATPPATYADLLKVPEPLIAEILDGELIQSPRPGLRHATSASVLGAQLLAAFHGPAGGLGAPGGW